MRLAKRVAKISLIVAAITLPMMAVSGCRNKPATTVASVAKDLHEHLPVGSSRSEVVAYLDQRGYEHSHIGESREFPESSRTEMAIIRDVAKSLFVRTDIQIVFNFDNSDTKLVSYSVREVFTGP